MTMTKTRYDQSCESEKSLLEKASFNQLRDILWLRREAHRRGNKEEIERQINIINDILLSIERGTGRDDCKKLITFETPIWLLLILLAIVITTLILT